MSKCTKFAGNADGITWNCTRERDHDGPCAMALAAGAQCGATWDFYVTDHTLTAYNVTCTLRRGHDLDHRGEIGWPS